MVTVVKIKGKKLKYGECVEIREIGGNDLKLCPQE